MIRVFIVEDSATVRRQLHAVFSSAEDFKIVGQAATGDAAVESIRRLQVDLVSLDVFLPGSSAADVVRRIRQEADIPIVLLSEAPRESLEVFEALAAGALDFMRKPRAGDKRGMVTMLAAMRALSRVKAPPVRRLPPPPPVQQEVRSSSGYSVLAIASSTGGPNALRVLLSALPKDFPLPVLIAQHLAEGFEEGLARWLQQACALEFQVAEERSRLRPGTVLLGRSGWDLVVAGRDEAALKRAPARGYHPSGDDLFQSAASVFGNAVMGVILSGIGSDGTLGAEAVMRAGGVMMAQDEKTSVVFGMPGSAAKAGVISYAGSPEELSRAILRAVGQSPAARPRPSTR